MRINNITITLPEKNNTQEADNIKLFNILNQLDNFVLDNQDLISTFSKPISPKTIFNTSKEIMYPEVSFNTDNLLPEKWLANNLKFGFNLTKDTSKVFTQSKNESLHSLSLDELEQKLKGRLIGMNHSGINFSPTFIKNKSYQEFKSKLAKGSTFYNYPTGEEWPFIIPSTTKEFQSDIVDTSLNRNPKFEIVYSEYITNSLIQLDFDTNFTKEEAFKLFPDPYGISYDGLENSFRTVFAKVDWGNVLLRFDIRFRNEKQDFGYWMIEDGGRI